MLMSEGRVQLEGRVAGVEDAFVGRGDVDGVVAVSFLAVGAGAVLVAGAGAVDVSFEVRGAVAVDGAGAVDVVVGVVLAAELEPCRLVMILTAAFRRFDSDALCVDLKLATSISVSVNVVVVDVMMLVTAYVWVGAS